MRTARLLHGFTAGCLALGLAGGSLADRTTVLQSGSTLLWLIGIGLAGITAQGLGASLVQAAAALLAVASLLNLHDTTQALRAVLQRSAALCALALPLLATTFVLLPRLEPLWSVAASQARSGLSERLAPGELASLVADDGLAARLSMAPALLPPPEQRYWRLLVHRQFDGEQWQAGAPAKPLAGLRPMQGTNPSQQRWMVEPNGLRQRPWSGRGQPQAATALQVTSTGTLVGTTALQERTLYDLNGTEAAGAWQQLPPTAADLQLPAAANPRLRALGEQWQRQGSSATQRLQLARQWFLQQGFRYTLDPGALGTINPLDGFLFETRAGFCEHFAASFSALMRAAGVPSRVVVGYQGGR
jgi:transglutaminase-like putative cysteine protease